jgi:hypothetical protein
LSPSDGIGDAGLFELRHPDRVEAVLEVIANGAFDLLLLENSSGTNSGEGTAELVDRLFRFSPCDAMILDPGASIATGKSRLLLPIGERGIVPALRFAAELVRKKGTVVPLLVGSEFGADSRAVARKELELKIRESGIALPEKFVPDVIVAKTVMEGLAREG